MALLWMLAKRHGRVYLWSTNATRTATNTIQRPGFLLRWFLGLGLRVLRLLSQFPGNLIRTGRASSARYIGNHANLQLGRQLDRHISLTTIYLHFFPEPSY